MRTGSGGPRLQRPRLSFQNVLSSFVDPVSERSSQTKAAAPLTCSAKAPTGPPRPPPSAECPRSIRCRSGCCPYLLESPDSQGPAPEPPRCALPSTAPSPLRTSELGVTGDASGRSLEFPGVPVAHGRSRAPLLARTHGAYAARAAPQHRPPPCPPRPPCLAWRAPARGHVPHPAEAWAPRLRPVGASRSLSSGPVATRRQGAVLGAVGESVTWCPPHHGRRGPRLCDAA